MFDIIMGWVASFLVSAVFLLCIVFILIGSDV